VLEWETVKEGALSMVHWHVFAIIVAVAFAPGVFWLWYFLKKDLEPEPLHLIRNCFLWGMAMVVPAGLIEVGLQAPDLVGAVVVAPIVEECLKFLAVYITIYRHDEFDEPMDGVIYAVAVALGFASLENTFYLYQAYKAGDGTLHSLAILRAVFSVPGHALFAIPWGYRLGIAKFSHKRRDQQYVGVGLLLGITFHAVFNFLSSIGPIWVFGMLILVPIMWQASHQRIGKALNASPHADTADYRERLRALRPKIAGSGADAWYQNRVVVILLLFLVCPPFGIYGLIKNARFSGPEKVSVGVLWGLVFGLSWYSSG
jgi:RsiW-degrading membrane proteinase PrsW (M82 family)